MKELKVKLLTGRSGTDGSHVPGEKIDLPVREALSLIGSDQAEPVNKQAYQLALKTVQEKETEDKEKQAGINAITQKEQLESKLHSLYEEVVLTEAELNGVVLDGEQVLEMVEELKKRIPLNNTYFDLNSLGGDQ